MLKSLKVKKDIIKIARILHSLGFVSGFDGNISIKLGKTIFITGTRSYKGDLKLSDIVAVETGNRISIKGKKNPSSEFLMHQKAYEIRSDINSVIHAHPFYTVLLTLIGLKINTLLTPESFIFLGNDIPVASYRTPGTFELAESAKLLSSSNIVVLERHGVLAVGKTIFEALDIIEKTENAARKTYYTLLSGRDAKNFKDKEVMELSFIRSKLLGKE